jgi:hypothetical protein
MIINNYKLLAVTMMVLVFVGGGCVGEGPVEVSGGDAKANAESLDLTTGSEIYLHETVFGIGGKIVDWLGGESESREIKINSFVPGGSVALGWRLETKVETEASKKVRGEYDEKYKESPIGEIVPKKPEAVFKALVKKGNLSTSALDFGEQILLPAYWQDGEVQAVNASTLIWISKKQYNELVNTKKTVLSLGLFDDSLATAAGFTDNVKNLLNKLKQDSEEARDREDILSVAANEQWGSYKLKVDGKMTTVRTIEAQNWFGRYTILANPNNPLILEIVLSPASRGSFNIFTRAKLLEAFLGYEVTEIK